MYARLGNAALVVSALLAASCTSNPYYIGAACNDCAAGGAGNSELSFAVDLNASGTSRLSDELASDLPATLQFRAEKAGLDRWASEQGPALASTGSLFSIDREAPFTDGTRAITFAAPAYTAESATLADVGADDFALELVLRASASSLRLDKANGGSGWSLSSRADGALELTLQSATGEPRSALSERLSEGAWYHCLVWASRAQGARIDCNGREGTLATGGVHDDLRSQASLGIGTAGARPAALAFFALFRASALPLASTWGDTARRRFAALTGSAPRVARGTLLPKSGQRSSLAYLDLEQPNGPRRLFLVGPVWPRVACRVAPGARECGYLSEGARPRWLDPEPSAWQPSELSVRAAAGEFADGEQRMSALSASSAQTAHRLSFTGGYGGARQVLSFFARAGSGHLVSVKVGPFDHAVFDLQSGTVTVPEGDVQARLESWGNGLFRGQYSFVPDPGPTVYTFELLATAPGAPFAGDPQSTFLELGAIQLDVNQTYAGSPLAAAMQAGDRLTFVGDDGNLPSASSVRQTLRVLLPVGPRLTDQALLNLNPGGSFDTQVQLYLTGTTSELKFWGLRDGDAHWAFTHPVSLIDGAAHAVQADWGPTFAALSVDGVSLQQTAQIVNDPPFVLDRIDVGFSSNSSGNLEGLVFAIELGALPEK